MRVRLISLFAVLFLGGCISINSDITVADGETVEEDLTSINGAIKIGSNATLAGDAETVNGSVSVGDESVVVGAVETVNGKVTLGAGVKVERIEAVNGNVEIGGQSEVGGLVETVNGRIVIGEGTVVGGRVGSINGQIRLSGATVGSLRNISGGMVLEAGSRVLGELRVDKPRGSLGSDSVTVEIHADCEVVGPLVFERPVNLRIHESATVGEIQGAEPVYYSD